MTSPAQLIDHIDSLYGWEPPSRIGIAVSGGSDSLALLHLLHAWGRSELVVATVDHGLRSEAKDEAVFVQRICEGLGVRHDTLRWRDWNGSGNLQDAAREARYGLLAKWGTRRGADRVLLGHTQDDVAETFLMRLGRQAGLEGLAAMRRVCKRNGQTFDRPLLDLSRAELRGYLKHLGVSWVEDPSNRDPRFTRVRAREVLDALAPLEISRKDLAEVARHLRAAAQDLAFATYNRAEQVAEAVLGDVVFHRKKLRVSGPEMERRLLQSALCWVSSQGYAPRKEAMMDLQSALSEGETRVTLHGCLIDVTGEEVRIAREFRSVWDAVCSVGQSWDQRWEVEGPEDARFEVRTLGEEGLKARPDWRESPLPRSSLLASPSVWSGENLHSALLLDAKSAWRAKLKTSFFASLLKE